MDSYFNNKPLIIILGITTGIILFSYIAGFIFAFLSGIEDALMPWHIWHYFYEALQGTLDSKSQSRLSLAFGVPSLGILFAGGGIYELISDKNKGLPQAKWANKADIRKAKLSGSEGLILGKFQGKYIMSDTPTHVAVIAPTRSGKGIGLVLPNLLNFNGSIVCLDVKEENFEITSGFRSQFGPVYKWSPMAKDGKTHCYNPFSVISRDKYQRITDLQILATALIPEVQGEGSVWPDEAQALFLGLALYVMETEENPTLGKIKRLMGAEGELGEICNKILDTHDELPTAIILSLRNFANKAAKERSGVKTTVNRALKLWDNDIVDSATSSSDFDISSLRAQKQTIYLSVAVNQIKTMAPLIKLFFEQTIKALAEKRPDPNDEPHQVLLLMDEFHLLGHMKVMEEAFTLLAGYNVRIMIVTQSLTWLDAAYNKTVRNGILSCCAHQIFFASNDLEDQEYVSKRAGQTSVQSESVSSRSSFNYEPKTKNMSYRTVPLIHPHEVGQLDEKKCIIFVEKGKPIMADKIIYDLENGLKERAHLKVDIHIPEVIIQEGIIPEFKKDSELDTDPNQGDMLTNDLLGKGVKLDEISNKEEETIESDKDKKKNQNDDKPSDWFSDDTNTNL